MGYSIVLTGDSDRGLGGDGLLGAASSSLSLEVFVDGRTEDIKCGFSFLGDLDLAGDLDSERLDWSSSGGRMGDLGRACVAASGEDRNLTGDLDFIFTGLVKYSAALSFVQRMGDFDLPLPFVGEALFEGDIIDVLVSIRAGESDRPLGVDFVEGLFLLMASVLTGDFEWTGLVTNSAAFSTVHRTGDRPLVGERLRLPDFGELPLKGEECATSSGAWSTVGLLGDLTTCSAALSAQRTGVLDRPLGRLAPPSSGIDACIDEDGLIEGAVDSS